MKIFLSILTAILTFILVAVTRSLYNAGTIHPKYVSGYNGSGTNGWKEATIIGILVLAANLLPVYYPKNIIAAILAMAFITPCAIYWIAQSFEATATIAEACFTIATLTAIILSARPSVRCIANVSAKSDVVYKAIISIPWALDIIVAAVVSIEALAYNIRTNRKKERK